MRQTVGVKADEDRAEDRKKREADPGQDQRREFHEPGISMYRFAGAHPVDDTAEENRLGELRARQSEVGEDEEAGQAHLGAEQLERAEISAGKRGGQWRFCFGRPIGWRYQTSRELYIRDMPRRRWREVCHE